jgi:hypothetical protein
MKLTTSIYCFLSLALMCIGITITFLSICKEAVSPQQFNEKIAISHQKEEHWSTTALQGFLYTILSKNRPQLT